MGVAVLKSTFAPVTLFEHQGKRYVLASELVDRREWLVKDVDSLGWKVPKKFKEWLKEYIRNAFAGVD